MMVIADILTPDRILLTVGCASKKRALESISGLLANGESNLGARPVFNQLCARERLGSTGMGEGVALPHCRLPNLDHTVGALLRINVPVDFDAPDGQPVDLLFGLAVPEQCTEEHLTILASLAETFSSEHIRNTLRGDVTPADAWQLVSGSTRAA